MEKIRVKDNIFIDETGRERIFHGINMVFKGRVNESTGIKEYKPDWNEETIMWLEQSGFNLIRLGIIWDAIEPEKDKINEEYLAWAERIISLCEKHNIYVCLDMHQDLFSEKYSDGAPAWATLDEGMEHYVGDMWSDSYLFSEAVKKSFDNFWANSQLEGKEGILDHYAGLWAHLANRFSGHDNLIGYDFLNEPFPGSSGIEVFATLLGAYAQITGKDNSLEELMELFASEEEKFRLLMEIDDYKLYSSMADAAYPVLSQFDEGILSEFYIKMRDAVREKTGNGAIFIENSYFSNMGIECAVKAIRDESQQVYSPHGYDMVVDSPAVAIASNDRVDVIFDAHKRVQGRLAVPVVVGEWGAHGKYTEGLYHIKHILGKFDENKWSHTYWAYFDGFETAPVLNVLKRPYPMAVAGRIEKYGYDYDTRTFTMDWLGNQNGGNTEIYLPKEAKSIKTDCKYRFADIGDRAVKLIFINCTDGVHKVVIKLKE